ncbi:hypothetical protein CW304_21450 [Bacillus sp. UFRGS-B20]|nr:hypothetical protein CW304_21450 [Bacillus sp. UFRGS-B20]
MFKKYFFTRSGVLCGIHFSLSLVRYRKKQDMALFQTHQHSFVRRGLWHERSQGLFRNTLGSFCISFRQA